MEEVTLTPGMELQLNSHQALFAYRHVDEESFMRVLLNAQLLQACREDCNEEPCEVDNDYLTGAELQQYMKDIEEKRGVYTAYLKDGAELRTAGKVIACISHYGKAIRCMEEPLRKLK